MGGGVNTAGVLTGEGTNQVEGEGWTGLGCSGNLFDIICIEVHAQSVNEVAIGEQNTCVVLKPINPKQNNISGVGSGVKNVSDTVLVDLQFEIFAHRPCIQKILRPVCSAEVHLVEGS